MSSSSKKEQATYSHGHHESVVKDHSRRTAQNSISFVLPHIKPTDVVLDVGCGPGTITVDIGALVPQGKVIGADSVESVLQGARELAQSRGLSNVTFQTADANELDFAAGTFDVVYCHQVLQHVQDPVGILKEMRRVCKPGGIVAARDADYRAFAWYPEHPVLDKWNALYLQVARANGGQPNAARYMPAWARDAGFDREGSVEFTWDTWLWRDDRARAFAASWTGRVLHSSFAETAKRHGLAGDQELQEIADAWKEWGAMDGVMLAIPNGQLLCHA